MKTILVDDDPIGLLGFELECKDTPGIELVGKFTSPLKALDFARSHEIEFALLDIDMPEMNGFELYDRLKELRSDMVIVFVTAHSGCAVEAMRKKADYVVFKPYDRAEIEEVLVRAELLKKRQKQRVYCRCFGRFGVQIDGKPVVFKSAKAKEILALCVYRQGAPVSAEEVIDKLWPDYSGTVGECSIFRFTIMRLVETLQEYHAESILKRGKGICYIDKTAIACDYYNFLDDDAEAICDFQNEFMAEYPWAESAVYSLQEKKELYTKKVLKREKSTNDR